MWAHLRWTSDRFLVIWEDLVRCLVRANETSEAKRQFSIRNRDVLMNILSPHIWWFTHKSGVLGSKSSASRLLVWVVTWCSNRLERMICCRSFWPQAVQLVCWSSADLPTVSYSLITLAYRSQCCVSPASSSGQFPCLLETGQCHQNFTRSIVLLCSQLPTDFQNISIV